MSTARPSDLIRTLAVGRGLLVAAHRGTPVASVGQNTLLAARGALASGADMVELDATVSSDGVVFAFHDGTEDESLGIRTNLQQLTAEQIGSLRHRGANEFRDGSIPRLVDVLGPLRGTGALVNLDRSWWRWPLVLDEVASLGMDEQVLVKFPASQPERADELRASGHAFPVMVICRTADEVAWAAGLDGLDVCAVELIAERPDALLASADFIASVHDRGLLVFVNCEVLCDGLPLFGGWDDELAIVEPDQPWSHLAGIGVDIVQTDWPWLADAWRRRHGVGRG